MCALKKKKQDEEYVCLREGKTRRSNVFEHKRRGVIIRAGCMWCKNSSGQIQVG